MDFVKSLQKDKISQMVKDLGVDVDVDVTPAKVIFMALLRSTGREGIEKLLSYLEKSDFFEAPASTKFHGNYKGALCVHSLGVAALLLEKNKYPVKILEGGYTNIKVTTYEDIKILNEFLCLK